MFSVCAGDDKEYGSALFDFIMDGVNETSIGECLFAFKSYNQSLVPSLHFIFPLGMTSATRLVASTWASAEPQF